MSILRNAALLTLLLALAGCATEEELAARDAARCESFGFKPGSEGYSNCRLQLYTERTRRPVVVDRPYFPPQPRIIVVPEKK